MPRPAVVSVLMVRNEFPVVIDTIGHLLYGVGVDGLIVTDNDSTDRTPEVLARIATLDDRVRIRHAPGGYRQAEVMTEMYREATADGADWVVPGDADEFLAVRAGTSIHEVVGRAPHDTAALQVRVHNMVQSRSVDTETPGAISTMRHRARRVGTTENARQLVAEGLPYVRIAYPPKLILRADPAVSLDQGQHSARDFTGAITPSDEIEILHAPIRARRDLETRVEHAKRLGDDPTKSWHLRRLRDFGPVELDREWLLNSAGRLPHRGWIRDSRLQRIAHEQASFRAAVLADLA